MTTANATERRTLIETIKTPLAFFSMIVLVIEACLGGLATLVASGADRTFLLYAIVGLLALLIISVVLISIFRPEALWGKRYSPLEEKFANAIGNDFHMALDGYLRNDKDTCDEAYRQLREITAESPYFREGATKNFYRALVRTILTKGKIIGKRSKVRGAMVS